MSSYGTLAAYERMRTRDPVDIPMIINGQEVFTGNVVELTPPHDHKNVYARIHVADGTGLVKEAVSGALAARAEWESMSSEARSGIFLRAARLLSTKYRHEVCAATMLGLSKNLFQAEIDAACETIDFWRFNAFYANEIYSHQPAAHSPGVWNRLEHRPLEGFVAAISPFNFIAIGSNLASAPAQMGNVVVLKPALETGLASSLMMRILQEAGLPPGVIQYVPVLDPRGDFTQDALHHPALGGLHFTGSTNVFAQLQRDIAAGIGGNPDTDPAPGDSTGRQPYHSFPRLVGETGGKNYLFAHESALASEEGRRDVAAQLLRGAFEFNGQKCSATSRAYVPASQWPALRRVLEEEVARIKVTGPSDPQSFVTAVINRPAFDRLASAIEGAKADPEMDLVAGGECDDRVGYFVGPTVLAVDLASLGGGASAAGHMAALERAHAKHTVRSELFGPVITVVVYDDQHWQAVARAAADASPYALTGAIFARDRRVLEELASTLRHAQGNLYLNDKSTGAVVGQQPFGGSRRSGTNDKAGHALNLQRWVSTMAIKENLSAPLTTWEYPYMME
ncbi:hypothetical protein H696_04570 [Fonticula alba]|uniref:L-glutamate gamma-semialdehyde dehydrogenase n=1 Tax=Fonticula alba TaxID=691883 RepID=A0A058Z4U8_FONAL|nr:hypothetical protein H696_04570 [Fonticula alba]KCV69156.1 hypothetical protein H696_04570 [Fonticula alba]|eukprot:XP_009496727.1 hypothetical protein H696_04570 [Fonticula alba]